jgi:hypothetical protein
VDYNKILNEKGKKEGRKMKAGRIPANYLFNKFKISSTAAGTRIRVAGERMRLKSKSYPRREMI